MGLFQWRVADGVPAAVGLGFRHGVAAAVAAAPRAGGDADATGNGDQPVVIDAEAEADELLAAVLAASPDDANRWRQVQRKMAHKNSPSSRALLPCPALLIGSPTPALPLPSLTLPPWQLRQPPRRPGSGCTAERPHTGQLTAAAGIIHRGCSCKPLITWLSARVALGFQELVEKQATLALLEQEGWEVGELSRSVVVLLPF